MRDNKKRLYYRKCPGCGGKMQIDIDGFCCAPCRDHSRMIARYQEVLNGK